MCRPSRGRVGPYFVTFVNRFLGSRAEENNCLLTLGAGGPGAEVTCAETLPRAAICAAEGRHMLLHEASWCSDGPVANEGGREIAVTTDSSDDR